MNTLTTYQANLFADLETLVADSEAFFHTDTELDGIIYRIFNYRLASYTDFLLPSALECRGTTFSINCNNLPIKLISLPFEKFFNIYENPLTMDLDLSTIEEIADKADGSLITTFLHRGALRVKSKGSLNSDQAVGAKIHLCMDENADFRNELIRGEQLGYTTIMEWCAPDNRIVLPYDTAHLKVLGVRSREDGSYVHFNEIDGEHFPETLKRWTRIINAVNPEAYINSVDKMQNIEGIVFRLASGQRVKKKCQWYLALHHTKDNINSPRRLFEAVLEEVADDMKSLFHDDPLALKTIAEMEEFVEEKYNHMVDTVERFYERNKDMGRKDYAILGTKELDSMFFGLAMSKYLGKEFSYKNFLKKQWKKLGLKDADSNDEN